MGDQEKYVTVHGSFTVEEDDVQPPPSDLKSRLKNLQEWLTYICKNEKPNKIIDTYNFGLFEGQNEYTLYLVGTNTYEVSKDFTQIRIEFSPEDMYFPLPEHDYSGLNTAQVYALITSQLKEFMKTDTYRSSHFLEATNVKTNWNGETWSK